MNIPKEAIEKAIEGGWREDDADFINLALSWRNDEDVRWEQIALDPSFWKCLGKALGWKESKRWGDGLPDVPWRDNAHRFYDLILTNTPTDEYWKKLQNFTAH